MSNVNGTFKITLVNDSKNINKTLTVGRDEYILDVAEEEGMDLPYSCRAGSCFDCLGKVVQGKVEQSDRAIEFLRPEELKAGYVLLCACSPRSDCHILTHQVEVLFDDDAA
ncbi:MAG: Ferredoxin-1 [Chroococcopsis gigantea SAG 12.99]|jgi:ferredoxin|nr:2Fe-2S iron-sulfur cluster binding domain-containing protein [Chlorogloea purpurea SAG 13.99]MDV3001190.1 Ferredoxin-1 [Chroococcopsis gigantea SAG 12.99]